MIKNLKVFLKKLALKLKWKTALCCNSIDNSMRKKLNFLPAHKQVELKKLTEIIKKYSSPEMVVLFGSYARNEWVEEKYDADHYRYQSDFDILIIVGNSHYRQQEKLEQELESRLEAESSIQIPVSLIVHDIHYVNQQLQKTHYFFSDIKKQGILLYDSGRFQLKKAKKLSPNERKRLAEEDYEYWKGRTYSFLEIVLYYKNHKSGVLKENDLRTFAFMLHQVTESLYTAALLVFTRYKPNTHDLAILRKLTTSLDNQFYQAFPLTNIENKRLFKLLRKSYVDARYKKSYTITREELLELEKRVEALRILVERLCQEKLAAFKKEIHKTD